MKKFLRLSPADMAVLIQAAIYMPVVRGALRFISISRLDSPPTKAPQRSVRKTKPEELARLVSIAANYGFYRPRCLEKSIVLRRLLARRGIDARVVFGTRKGANAMEAHAWVEVNGMPLNEDDSAHLDFARLDQVARPS